MIRVLTGPCVMMIHISNTWHYLIDNLSHTPFTEFLFTFISITSLSLHLPLLFPFITSFLSCPLLRYTSSITFTINDIFFSSFPLFLQLPPHNTLLLSSIAHRLPLPRPLQLRESILNVNSHFISLLRVPFRESGIHIV
jgi:hypothetical protein